MLIFIFSAGQVSFFYIDHHLAADLDSLVLALEDDIDAALRGLSARRSRSLLGLSLSIFSVSPFSHNDTT